MKAPSSQQLLTVLLRSNIEEGEAVVGWTGRVVTYKDVLTLPADDQDFFFQIDEDLFQVPFVYGQREPAVSSRILYSYFYRYLIFSNEPKHKYDFNFRVVIYCYLISENNTLASNRFMAIYTLCAGWRFLSVKFLCECWRIKSCVFSKVLIQFIKRCNSFVERFQISLRLYLSIDFSVV